MPSDEVVPCSEYVKEELEKIKKDEGHTSYDSVLRTLLGNYQQ